MDAGSAPERIGEAHLPDQSPNFWRDAGPAGTPTGFPAPEGAKACRCQRITVSGSTIVMASRIRGTIRYKQTKIIRSKLLKTGCRGDVRRSTFSLMAQSEYLCLERRLRAKPPEEHPPDQAEQVPHRAFIARFGPSRQADGICDSDSCRYLWRGASAPSAARLRELL